ncbi:MAG TPA: Crp/Fnr family transcriptional regulator [Thermoleophilia bacterium]|nr:Crp/Fnr family transcriptional regulator [Thermoleophilia bacterium]
MRCTCEEIAAGTEGLSPICFAHLWLFQNLPERDAKALTEAAWRKQYQAGELVFLQGDQARIMFIIKAGRVKLAKAGTDGGEVLVDIRKAGDFLGETFLSDDAEYPLTAECMEESLLCGFTKARFERLVTDNPNIGLQIIRNMSDRISWLTSRASSTSATHLEECLHAVLTDLAHEHGTITEKGLLIQFPLTHAELGFLVGAHRVSVTKALKALRESGRVIRQGKHLVLPGRQSQ